MSRPAEALPIFERLSQAYPQEPRPRGGRIEARLDTELAAGDEEVARKNLEEELAAAPEGFAETAEGRYLQGRAAELARDWESALDHYEEQYAAATGQPRAALGHIFKANGSANQGPYRRSIGDVIDTESCGYTIDEHYAHTYDRKSHTWLDAQPMRAGSRLPSASIMLSASLPGSQLA